MKKQALFHKNGRHSLKRCLLILLSVCMIIQTVPIVSFADQKPGTRLRAAAEEGLEIIHSLPNLAEKNNVIGYDYYDTLPWYWEGLQRTFDLFGIHITDALTNMNRSQYYFTMALTMCSKAEPIDWTSSEALQRALGVNGNSYNIDEIIETFQLIYDEDSPLFTSDILQYAKALKAANYSIKGIDAFCDIVNEYSLFLSLDWDQVGYLIEAWQENGNNELKEIASVLKNMKDVFSGSVESTLLIMQILAKHGLDIIIDGMIDTTLNAVADGALFFYKAALFGVDLVTRFSVLTGSFNDMKYAAEALEACNKRFTKANKFFFLDDEYYIETEEARDRLKKDFTWLAYLGINYAEACAIMDDAYVNYIELGKNSMAGNLYIDKTMIDRADRARNHANQFREQADQIRNQLKLVNLLIDNGGMMPEDVELYEDYKKDWAHHWVMRDYPENYLDITFEWDYTMKVVAHFEGMPDNEYELKIYEDMTDTGFFGDPFEGLTGSLWVNDPLERCLTAEFGYIGEIDRSNPLFPYIIYYENGSRYGSEQYYVIDDDTVNSDYYRDGWEEPVYLGPEGVEELFDYLSDQVLLAASGAGAWEGRIKFDKDGGFTAYYYDEDVGDEVIYEVYFTGRFDTSSIQLDGTNGYLLRASEISTQHTPGTEAVTDFGSRIVYEEPLFKVGETLLLTRPGTPDPEIPEMVQSEIGGVFGQWEDFETFITLSRLADGWGFFADETSPFTWDVEPFKTIRQPDPSLPLFGVDHDYTGWGAKEVFSLLSKQKMFSMDSSGNWTSEMRVNSDGSFYGVYYDYDITGLFISAFSGSFSTNVEWCGKTNGYLTVKDFAVKNEPYTNGITADGMEFMYTDGPFQTGERLFFTLPGTHTEDIPEDVRSHIYWYYDPFDNYLSHITLNKIDWGSSWWLYADTDYPDTSDITPIALAETDEAISKEGSLFPFEDSETYTSGKYQYAVLPDGTARITKYTGNDTEIHIPASLDGYSISQIGARAFFNNENLESVWMDQAPLTVIQYESFRGCENIRFVQLPKTLKEIQYMAFDYCIGLTEIVLFEQVQIIGRRAFSYCKKLGEVYCPDSLLYIDESAFDQCDKKTIWFHVDPDSHAEHYCALYGYNYRYGISGNYNPNLETIKQTIDETQAKGSYADVWVNRWISQTKPELVLNITRNGDDTLHAALNASQETLLSFDFIPNDNIPESIDMCSGGEEMSFLDFITMNIDAEEGYALRLEGDIQEFDKPALTGGLQWEDLLFTASEYMPDPLMYGFEPLWRGPVWDGHWRAQKDGHQADLFIANADNESGYVIRMIMDETNVFDCSEIGFYDPYTMMIDFDKFAGMFVLNDDSISFELDPLSNDLRFVYFDFTMNATFYYAGGYSGQQVGLITPFSDTISIMYTNSPTRRQDVQFSTEMFQRNNEKCYLDIALLSMTLSTAAYNSASDKEDQAGLNIVSAYRSLGILDKDIMLFNYKGNKLNTNGYNERSSSFSIASRDMGGYTLLLIVMRGTSTRIDIFRNDFNVQDLLTDANADSAKIINVRAHEGFHYFASLAATGFDKYLEEHPKVQKALEEKKLKVLITGHSLGAAAANLLGAYINGEFYGDLRIPQRDLYVYTFATPRTFFPDGKVPQTSSSTNIFNFLVRSSNSDLVDPVTIVPSDSRHEWQRFGRMAMLTTMKTSGKMLDHHDMQNYIDAIVYKIQHNESIALSIDKLDDQIYTCK
ncbi:MAG: leucine-rich repeat protein [Clostridia bacterium]|nr:leucine-rich repeat protein [Clostridia bacterium]